MAGPVTGDVRPRLRIERRGEPRKYLWLKAVTGVDLEVHCADSLTGRYLSVDRQAWRQHVLLPPAPAWYFCGVTDPFVWRHNDHALLIPDPGNHEQHTTQGYELTLWNVAATYPVEQMVPQGARHAEDPWYRTCRNWQAAHWLASRGRVPARASRAS